MAEGFGQEYPLGGEKVLNVHEALVWALQRVETATNIVSRNMRNENGCRNVMTFAPEDCQL
jgi:hypothetical protein